MFSKWEFGHSTPTTCSDRPSWGCPEELLFFVHSYCSVFTYFSLQHYVKRNPLKHAETTLTISAILICAALVVVFFPRNYISLTSLFTLAWLVWAQRNAKPFMADLWLAFFVLLVPFVISNGVLTGLSFWEKPFIHNDAASITTKSSAMKGWRIFTMPPMTCTVSSPCMHIAGIEADAADKRLA